MLIHAGKNSETDLLFFLSGVGKEDGMEAAGTIKILLWMGRMEQREKLWKALFYKENRGKRTKLEAPESVTGVPASTEKHIDKTGRI